MESNSKKAFIIDVIYAVLSISIVLFVGYAVWKFLLPFVLAVVIALLVQRPSRAICNKLNFKKGITAAILSFGLYLLVGVLLIFAIYRLFLFLAGLVDVLPDFFNKTAIFLKGFSEEHSQWFSILNDKFDISVQSIFGETLQKLVTLLGDFITKTVTGFVKNVPTFFITGIVTLVATCLIAKDYDRLKKFLRSLLGEKITKQTVRIKNILFGSVFKLLKGYMILAVLTFAQLYVGFLILGVNNAFVSAFLISLIDLLPVLGAGIVIVPWAVFSALSGNYFLGVGLGVLFVITIIVRNVCEPRIIGKQIGISPLFTLVSMYLGLEIMGFAGLLLFPIILIVVIRYYKDEMNEGLSEFY